MQPRRNTMLQKIGFRKRKILRTTLNQAKWVFKSTRRLIQWWERLKSKLDSKKKLFSKSHRNCTNLEPNKLIWSELSLELCLLPRIYKLLSINWIKRRTDNKSYSMPLSIKLHLWRGKFHRSKLTRLWRSRSNSKLISMRSKRIWINPRSNLRCSRYLTINFKMRREILIESSRRLEEKEILYRLKSVNLDLRMRWPVKNSLKSRRPLKKLWYNTIARSLRSNSWEKLSILKLIKCTVWRTGSIS